MRSPKSISRSPKNKHTRLKVRVGEIKPQNTTNGLWPIKNQCRIFYIFWEQDARGWTLQARTQRRPQLWLNCQLDFTTSVCCENDSSSRLTSGVPHAVRHALPLTTPQEDDLVAHRGTEENVTNRNCGPDVDRVVCVCYSLGSREESSYVTMGTDGSNNHIVEVYNSVTPCCENPMQTLWWWPSESDHQTEHSQLWNPLHHQLYDLIKKNTS